MGGFMALRFALRHQDRLNGLILIDTLAAAPRSPHEELFGNLRDGGPLDESIVEWHADIVFGPTTKAGDPDLVEHWRERWRGLTGASVYWESASWLRREDVAARLSEITVPTLVIHGEEDEILPMEGAELMAREVRDGRLARIAGAGHTANTERPDEVNAALREFLRGGHAVKAAVLRRFGDPLELSEVPDPSPGDGEVLVRVRAVGLCGTDLKVVAGTLPGLRLPLIPGHEVAGEVIAGELAGSKVACYLYEPCGHCRWCRASEHALCPTPAASGAAATAGSPST